MHIARRRARRSDTTKRRLVGGSIFAVICGFLVYTFAIVPIFATADAQYLSGLVVADNGEVTFASGNPADFSFVRNGAFGATSKIYDAKIVVRDLPSSGVAEKKLTIALPLGMNWVDDASADKNLQSQLDASKGNNGVEKIAANQEPVLGYTFSGAGARTYYMLTGTQSVTVNIKVSLDTALDLGYITDAIKATLTLDDYEESIAIDVNAPLNASAPGKFHQPNYTYFVSAGSTYSTNEGYNKLIRASWAGGAYDVKRLATQARIYLHVENSAATLQLTTTDVRYSLEDKGNGDYILYYTPTAASNMDFTAPFGVVVPNDAVGGSTITLTGRGETDYWQIGGGTRTVDFQNTWTLKLRVAPTDEKVTIGYNSLNPDPTFTAQNLNVTTRVPVAPQEEMTGVLGYNYINNRGSQDSAPKTVKMTFDTEVLGVMMVRLSCTPGGTISTVHIKTKSGLEKDVALNKTCNAYGWAGEFSYVDFGTERTDYLAEVVYDAGVIPAVTQLRRAITDDSTWSITYVGARLSDERNGVSTLEVYDTANPENTTGISKMTTVFSAAGSVDLTTMPTQVVEAGSTLKFNIRIAPYASSLIYQYSILEPIIYIRQELRDKDGNFLPISNIKVTNGSARGNVDITSKFGQITYRDTDTARVYMIDGRGLTDGSANVSIGVVNSQGKFNNTSLDLSYSIETSLTTPDQTYNMRDMVFVQEAGVTSSPATHHYSGDTFNIANGVAGSMVHAVGSTYYQVRGSQSIEVDNKAKHASTDTWSTWSEDTNPIAIGTSESSALDMSMQAINNSGVEVPGPTVMYMPVPKQSENWGTLNYNEEPFEFSTMLKGALTNPDPNIFEIYYGKNIVPTDNGTELDSRSAQFASDVSGWTEDDWRAVNCVKIVARNIPPSSVGDDGNYDFGYELKVIDIDRVRDGATDTWRAIYYQQLTNSNNDVFSGWYGKSFISIRLSDSKINGTLFVDSNENGKWDNGEQALAESGWRVELYDRSSNRLVQTTETDAQGKYEFIELLEGEDGYYINVVNKHPVTAGTDGGYLFTKKGDASNIGSYNTDNQAVGNKNSTPIHDVGYIGPVSPAREEGVAIYNAGVIGYVANENYTLKAIFADGDNADNLRPVKAKITAKAEGAEDTVIELDPTGAEQTVELPLYSATGDKLYYRFTAEDLLYYDKTFTVSGKNVTVKYTQKQMRVESKINIKAPGAVDTKDAKIDYEIEYDATITNYVGDVDIEIVQKLPYAIDVDESELDGAIYDEDARTLTWTVSMDDVNTFAEDEALVSVSRRFNVALIYKGVKARDNLRVTVTGNSSLSRSANVVSDSVNTSVATPGENPTTYDNVWMWALMLAGTAFALSGLMVYRVKSKI